MPNAGEGIFWGDAQSDPKRKYRFFFYLGGVPVWVVKSVSAKPEATIASTSHTYLNHEFKYPGRVTWNSPISVTMGDPVEPDLARTLINIVRKSGYDYPTGPGAIRTTSKGKAIDAIGGAVRIVQLDADGNEIEVWELKNAWIEKVTFGQGLDYTDDELQELSVDIAFDWAELTRSAGNAVAGYLGTE
tara:strand:+ start:450 stop:1013 length:564 start_codon:yes stop_codon:yes gene_type:complete